MLTYPFLNVNIFDKFYRLLVDSGSNKTIIFSPKKSLEETKYFKKRWVRFKTFLVPTFSKKVNLKFKNIILHTTILIVDWQKYIYYAKNMEKNLKIFRYFQNFGCDGILGLDILRKIILEIDCKNNKAKIIKFINNHRKFQWCNLYNINAHLGANINIDGHQKLAIIDTGINIADIVLKRKHKNCNLISKKEILLWNKKKLINVYKLNISIQFMNRDFKNLKFAVLNILKNDNPIICYPFLKRLRRVIFDNGKRILYFLIIHLFINFFRMEWYYGNLI